MQAFRDAGVDARDAPHIDVELWPKLIFLASMAAAAGLARAGGAAVRVTLPIAATPRSLTENAYAVLRADILGRLVPGARLKIAELCGVWT